MEKKVDTSSSNTDVSSVASQSLHRPVTPLTPEVLKKIGFKKKRSGDGYWFELKYKNWTFITNDNYYSETCWHIGFSEREHTSETIFLHHCDNLQHFKQLFLVLTNSELNVQPSVATGDAQRTEP
jgi:hypothetical protein